MDTKISIIIPAYNVAGYIENCLKSMIRQTYPHLEIIVIDDGSTDHTPRICDEFAARDSRIVVIHKKNEGVSAARNTGIEMATGTYICFFDGDDFIEPETCGELIHAISENASDALIYGYYRYEDDKVKETCLPIFAPGIYEGMEIQKVLLPRFIGFSCQGIDKWLNHEDKALYVENPALWRIMISRSVILESGIRFRKNLKIGEDTIFITEYLSHSQKCRVYPKCYYYLVTRSTSAIYQYEKNPTGKLEGKKLLLQARLEITEEIKARTGIDISGHWHGTIVMSVIEMAFLLSKKNPAVSFFQRYRMFQTYAENKMVKRIVRSYQPEYKWKVMALPFHLLRWHLNILVFVAAMILNFMHYEFNRN